MQRSLCLVAAAAMCATWSAHDAREASAHHSASSWHALYRERYLICTDAKSAARVHCVGPNEARAPLLAALKLGDLAPGKNHDSWTDPAHEAAIDAAYFHVRDAIAPLRAWLAIRLEAGDRTSSTLFTKQALRTDAAFALARLGDAQSAQAISELALELETDGVGSLWEDTLAALVELEPARASRYAIEFLGRQTDFRMSLPGGGSKLIPLDDILPADGACDAVIAAAPSARPEAVEGAWLALTALGDACLPQIEQLADDKAAPSEVRGAALELTAALESPRLCAHLARAKADGVWHPAIERAEAMRDPHCEPIRPPPPPPPVRPGEQPVPPRIFHQGQ